MSTLRLAVSTLAMAIAADWHTHANAQTAAAPAEQAAALPEIKVEAPAKRNRQKARLRGTVPQRTVDRAAPAAPVTPAPAALETQVIEGEKVTRTLRDTTTSVGVVTGKDIAERQIRDVKEAIEQTANVITTDKSTGVAVRGMNSEGLTQTQHISAVPLIGFVVDGATQNPDAVRRGARGLWDVEQVEVLRGPQSTLQGRNALGGVVNVKTNDPTYTYSGLVEGTLGSENLKAGGFVLNTPIVPGQSAFRISGYTADRDKGIGYFEPQNQAMGRDFYSTVRAKLLIEPEALPGLSALFTVARTVDKPGMAMVSGPDFFRRYLDYSAAFTDYRNATANNYVSDVSYEFMPGLKIRSLTAFADTKTIIKTPIGAAFQRDGDNTVGKDFTQDLQLQIENQGNGLSGVAGLFYGNFKRDNLSNSLVYLPYFFPGAPDMTIPYNRGTYAAHTTSVAAYADLRYRIERWQLLAGGRLLRDTVKTQEDARFLDVASFTYLESHDKNSAHFNEFLPKVGVSYDLTSNQTIGLTYNKGYRTGFERRGADNQLVTVQPEYLSAYEVSYRSNWFDKTLELNANVFYYDYKNQQIAVLNPTYQVSEIFNAGRSHAYGSEVEVRWRPISPLQIFAAVGVLQTKFDELVFQGVSRAGNEYPEAPGYTISAGAFYQSTSGWFAGANVRHIDGYYSTGDITNNMMRFGVDPYTVVDARVGWKWKHATLTLWAKNLFDEKYLTGVDRLNNPPLSPAYAFIGDPRTFGVTLAGHF